MRQLMKKIVIYYRERTLLANILIMSSIQEYVHLYTGKEADTSSLLAWAKPLH